MFLFTVPSGSPTITEAMAISPTEIEMTWNEVDPIDQNGIIIVYEVDYQPAQVFNGSMTVDVVNTTNTTILLSNLHESVQYNITVHAYTRIGPGPFSSHVLSFTQEARKFILKPNISLLFSVLYCNLGPASAPINVAAVSISSTQVKVTWGDVPPRDQNGIIITYEVEYIPLEDFGGAIEKNTTNVSALSVILMRLQEYVNYTISVRAYASAGAGPYSDPVNVITNEDGKCV